MTLEIFSLGAERSRWLAARVHAIAANVANADTPGYVARDVVSFEDAMTHTRSELGWTQRGRMPPDDGTTVANDLTARSSVALKHSGNDVNLEAEMARLGDARSRQSMVAGILGAFHQMLISSAKG